MLQRISALLFFVMIVIAGIAQPKPGKPSNNIDFGYKNMSVDEVKQRKLLAAAIKKENTKPGRKLTEELKGVWLGEDSAYRLEMDYPANQRRIVYIITNGENNPVNFNVFVEGLADYSGRTYMGQGVSYITGSSTYKSTNTGYIPQEAMKVSNRNGYTVSELNIIGPALFTWIFLKDENKWPAKASVLVFTEKDDKAWEEFKKVLNWLPEDYEPKIGTPAELAKENKEAKAKLEKIKVQLNVLLKEATDVYEYLDRNWYSEHMEAADYRRYMAKVAKAYDIFAAYLDKNPLTRFDNNKNEKIVTWTDHFNYLRKETESSFRKIDKTISDYAGSSTNPGFSIKQKLYDYTGILNWVYNQPW